MSVADPLSVDPPATDLPVGIGVPGRRRRLGALTLALGVALAPVEPANPSPDERDPETCDAADGGSVSIRSARLRGEIAAAEARAREMLACPSLPDAARVRLHLELARVLDRIGLHHNTRPVIAALDEIERAESLLDPSERLLGAEVEFARAYHHYRAEAQEGAFPLTLAHTEAAIRGFEAAGDPHGSAEAVHLLGLVHMQRGRLDEALDLFERSRRLDAEGGTRDTFLGDYHRHVALVHRARGDLESALPHFERSLGHRRNAGALDASLFAAASLGSTLVALGRLAEARQPLLYALVVARRLDSPRGTATAAVALGDLLERLGDRLGAVAAYELAAARAASIGLDSLACRAREALSGLRGPEGTSTGDKPAGGRSRR